VKKKVVMEAEGGRRRVEGGGRRGVPTGCSAPGGDGWMISVLRTLTFLALEVVGHGERAERPERLDLAELRILRNFWDKIKKPQPWPNRMRRRPRHPLILGLPPLGHRNPSVHPIPCGE